MSEKYILRGKRVVPIPGLMRWAAWMETAVRRVAFDQIGESNVSTVFLGLNHNFSNTGSPLVFETMVFGGPLDGEQRRYSTWKQAQVGHQKMVRRLRGEP